MTVICTVAGDSYRGVVRGYNVGNTLFVLPGLSAGVYDLNLTFYTVGNNKYINRMSSIDVVPSIYYISPNGTGSGTVDDPGNWGDISSAFIGGTVVFLDGFSTCPFIVTISPR